MLPPVPPIYRSTTVRFDDFELSQLKLLLGFMPSGYCVYFNQLCRVAARDDHRQCVHSSDHVDFTLGWSHWAVTPNVVRDVSGRAQRPLGVPLSRIELH
jgi:hypothetical protein